MTKFKKLTTLVKSLLMLIVGTIILLAPSDSGYFIVSLILGATISILGIKNIIFYFTHAKHMISGGKILINGTILLNFGILFFFVLLDKKSILPMAYLIFVFAIIGVLDTLRSLEIKNNGDTKWIIKFIKGLLTIAIALVCIIFIKSTEIMLLMFGISWIILAIEGIISCFYKSSIIYIE